MLFNLPNLLTLARILAVPLNMGAFYMDRPFGMYIAVVLFVVAGITDFFDGYLARSTGAVSKLGQFLAPIADKLMVGAILMMLVWDQTVDGVHVIAAIIILSREILVSGLREFLAGTEVSVPVSQLAKWKTAVQMIAIGALVLAGANPPYLPAIEVGLIGLWLAALLTLITGYDYLRHGLKHMT